MEDGGQKIATEVSIFVRIYFSVHLLGKILKDVF